MFAFLLENTELSTRGYERHGMSIRPNMHDSTRRTPHVLRTYPITPKN